MRRGIKTETEKYAALIKVVSRTICCASSKCAGEVGIIKKAWDSVSWRGLMQSWAEAQQYGRMSVS